MSESTIGDSLLVLGRQPALGLAELESLYGASCVRPCGASAALVMLSPSEVDFARLGGSTRLCKVLAKVDSTDWRRIEKELASLAPKITSGLPAGKLKLGLSAIGFHESPQKLIASGLTLKKIIQKSGRSVRLVPNQASELSSAQVIHNNLTGALGCELVAVAASNETLICQTVSVQDIASYTLRDRDRPKRDARVGMLPPKLAQIIINLATGQQKPDSKLTILDPFCGTGVILQEALLMGFGASGSDIEPRMGDYMRANIDWLRENFPDTENVGHDWQLGDATSLIWEQSEFIEKNGEVIDTTRVPANIHFVASEVYLGRPFTSQPSPEILAKTVSECNLIIKKFLRNIFSQLKPDTRLCLAVPAWQTSPGKFKHLPLIDSLEEIGYNRVSFDHASSDELIYYREGQIVARELLVLTRK